MNRTEQATDPPVRRDVNRLQERASDLGPHVDSPAAHRGRAKSGSSGLAAHGDEVVVLWRQRGASPGGDRVDSPVLGLYEIRDGELARAQMFYFDSSAVADFLARAKGRAA
jgi:ketosteroid isomerase-like protein